MMNTKWVVQTLVVKLLFARTVTLLAEMVKSPENAPKHQHKRSVRLRLEASLFYLYASCESFRVSKYWLSLW